MDDVICISNWYIKYDTETKMPDNVIGVLSTDFFDKSIGETITINEIEYMDQANNIIVSNGIWFKLIGNGTRVLYIDEFQAREMESYYSTENVGEFYDLE